MYPFGRLNDTILYFTPVILRGKGTSERTAPHPSRGLRPFAYSSPHVTRRPPAQAGLAETTVPRRRRSAGGRSRGLAHVSEARAEELELGGGGGCGQLRRPGEALIGEAAVYQKGTFVPFASDAACLHVLEFYYSKNKCHLFD
ncbi:hypothetical protein R6Z07F_017800 [Ovis aries]